MKKLDKLLAEFEIKIAEKSEIVCDKSRKNLKKKLNGQSNFLKKNNFIDAQIYLDQRFFNEGYD